MGGRGGRGERPLWEHRVFQDVEPRRSCCRSIYHGGILIGCFMQGTLLSALVISGVCDQRLLVGWFPVDPGAWFLCLAVYCRRDVRLALAG